MREIKFRGKRPLSGKWIYGYLFQNGIYSYILSEKFKTPECSCEVLTETIGQYTGLKYKNRKGIFEGDIVTDYYEGGIGIIFFDESTATYNVVWHEGGKTEELYLVNDDLKFIGNVHENPELLKE